MSQPFISQADAERIAGAVNQAGHGARLKWYEQFGEIKPAELPAARLAEAHQFVGGLSWLDNLAPSGLIVPRRNGHQPADTGSPLPIEDLAAIAARVDAAPDPGWLASPVWPADAYGIIGAENKAGKTWALADLGVAKAAGTAWLGHWPVDQAGPVLLFLGEGGERKMVRRLRAVARFHGVTVEDLPIRLCLRAPELTALEHRDLIRAELDAHPAALVGLDPLYLSARGANGASLYEMGTHLAAVQALAQDAGAALAVVHHWNQTGTGKGRSRFSGAGPAEWGRVTVSLAVEQRRRDAERSVVTLKAEIVGDEVADTEATFVRTVWADDPDDLRSPMHYEVALQAVEGNAEAEEWRGPTECMGALATLFHDLPPGTERSKSAAADSLRALGYRFRTTTINEALERLAMSGVLAVRKGRGRYFRLARGAGDAA